ncbi:MAG: nitrogenase [Oscillatoriales cyanobacterium RM2_1_1]|nr:nitrogenase [Oscillatoriales cyanobacterium SM2_3_0]NJO45512.1 nitrogenase [Oscillatoriales cyanobacterium RM2_1_1]
MTNATQPTYTPEQTTAWLRGLLALAWVDGHFDEEEKELITSLTHGELVTDKNVADLEPISPQGLATVLGQATATAENFLRTAVMVALADGVYSIDEDRLLREFCGAMDLKVDALDALRHTMANFAEADSPVNAASTAISQPAEPDQTVDLLSPVKHWLDDWEVQDPKVAHFVCKLIPPQCPFERDVKLFGRKVVHIPPMCKLNPLYEQLVGLRFRALSYLADDCKEDVSKYC